MATSASTRYILRWTEDTGAPRELQLPAGALMVGRAGTNGLVLSDRTVSRVHARIDVGADGVMIRDENSSNGVYVNGERVPEAVLQPGDQIDIGAYTIRLDTPDHPLDLDNTILPSTLVAPEAPAPAPEPRLTAAGPAALPEAGVIPEEWLARPILSERELAAAGVEVKVCEYAALGGGLGSFVWVDYLRISGAPPEDIAVVGFEPNPHGKYERFCVNSQIPAHERLRSNSDSCPDNVWGFPGYAVREIGHELKRLHLKSAGSTLWSIFGEPAIAQTYTPRSGDVFRSIDKEAARIGYDRMFRPGRIRAIRKSEEGRLLAVVSESDEHRRKHLVVAARFLHLAIGYPAIQLLPDLADYREKNPHSNRVVNAYEEHEHVYQALRRDGGTVVVRGRGIVASRIIQRLNEERAHNPGIVVIHLHRTRLTQGHRYGASRRRVENQAEFQAFNWPKGTWGGEHRDKLERASDEERKRLLDLWGGTTTANRRDWRRILNVGLREGWYRAEFGAVREVTPTPDGRVVTHIQNSLAGGGTLELVADFVVDCTGLIAAPDRSVPMNDLIATYNPSLNKLGRIRVANDFEVEALRHGDARLYMSGATTLGGPYAVVDTFLGLQYAALSAVTSMRKQSPRRLRRLSGFYSFSQWLNE
jgi:pSer/pThr/pTyr-binding forkhead associated (FHA) protein